MRKITKKHVKKLKEGDYGTLLECVEYLLDTYDEDNFSRGYDSCISDMNVHAGKLAEYITDRMVECGEEVKQLNKGSKPNVFYVFNEVEQLKQIIDEYFNREINGR